MCICADLSLYINVGEENNRTDTLLGPFGEKRKILAVMALMKTNARTIVCFAALAVMATHLMSTADALG